MSELCHSNITLSHVTNSFNFAVNVMNLAVILCIRKCESSGEFVKRLFEIYFVIFASILKVTRGLRRFRSLRYNDYFFFNDIEAKC